MSIYIQRKDNDYKVPLETVGEYDTYGSAMIDLSEHRMWDKEAHYYISSRACKEWREDEKDTVPNT